MLYVDAFMMRYIKYITVYSIITDRLYFYSSSRTKYNTNDSNKQYII